MARLVAYLVLLGVALYVAQAVAPLLIVGAVGLLALAWKRPTALEPVIGWPKLASVPPVDPACEPHPDPMDCQGSAHRGLG